jgi:tetratricopeptide (TPR) repeat protein
MATNANLQKKATNLFIKHEVDIEFFKGFILGLVWLDVFDDDSNYAGYLDIPDCDLSYDEHTTLREFALKIEDDILCDGYRFSRGCKVEKDDFSANYQDGHKLFEWSNGVYRACQINELFIDEHDEEVTPNAQAIVDRIAHSVFPFADKKFALQFFEEINETAVPEPDCAYLLSRLRDDMPQIIREISAIALIPDQMNTEDFDEDLGEMDVPLELSGPVTSVHPYLAGISDQYELNARIDQLLREVMVGARSKRVKLVEVLLNYAEKALGEAFFDENAGNFWSIFETRSYMRTLVALAEAYRSSMKREEAVGCYERALELCTSDNLGIRYLLTDLYMELQRTDDALALIDRFPDDDGALINYARALASFVKHGDSVKSHDAAVQAIAANQIIPSMLLGEFSIPAEIPAYYSSGDESEAIVYASENSLLWRNIPGALEWLKNERDLSLDE